MSEFIYWLTLRTFWEGPVKKYTLYKFLNTFLLLALWRDFLCFLTGVMFPGETFLTVTYFSNDHKQANYRNWDIFQRDFLHSHRQVIMKSSHFSRTFHKFPMTIWYKTIRQVGALRMGQSGNIYPTNRQIIGQDAMKWLRVVYQSPQKIIKFWPVL